jgi:SAM-dependent methyltransferase
MSVSDRVFTGSIPQIYETYLVPLIFAPYALDAAQRLRALNPSRILEIAAGTGVVTRALASTLAAGSEIIATDLNQAMLDQAAAIGTSRAVQWQQADAQNLPFADACFDVVVCQFGAMFFPDKARAFAEARRVLRRGGTLVFSVWDCIETNEFADVVTTVLAAHIPHDPPRFLARTPHGYCDRDAIARDVAAGGFQKTAQIDTVAARSRAVSAGVPAFAYCQGTPLRSEIEARQIPLAEATDAAAAEIARRFGSGTVDGAIQAHVVSIEA